MDSIAWDFIHQYAAGTMPLPNVESSLHTHLGNQYVDGDWRPALKAVTSGIYLVTICDIYVLFRIYFGTDSQKGTDSSKTKISRSVIYPDNFSDYPNYL